MGESRAQTSYSTIILTTCLVEQLYLVKVSFSATRGCPYTDLS